METDCKRIWREAQRYQKGILLSAFFKDDSNFILERFYMNPIDIPLRIYWHFPYSVCPDIPLRIYWHYLYSVCPADKRLYPKTKPKVNRDPQVHFK